MGSFRQSHFSLTTPKGRGFLRIIKKREFVLVLERLIGALATSVIIEDHAGTAIPV
jgi:hypothetical protein